MGKLLLGTTLCVMILGLNGCANNTKVTPVNMDATKLNNEFEAYKAYGDKKAMAVAMDVDGRYSMGYASDYSSQARANARAVKECSHANSISEHKVTAECELYAEGNTIVRNLDTK